VTAQDDAEKVTDLVRTLSALPELDPRSVGQVLGAPARLVREHADIPPRMEEYHFDAQPDSFRGEAELRWIATTRRGFLSIDVAKRWRSKIPMGPLVAAFGQILSFIPPDPRNTRPDRAHLMKFGIPIGDLGLAFPDSKNDYTLQSISITQTRDAPAPKE
jgi:hypothetical protein